MIYILSIFAKNSFMGYIYDKVTNSFLAHNSEKDGILPHIIWHITDLCRLKCPYCFATKTNKSFPLSQIEEYIELFQKLGVQKIDISGGEPLLYPNLSILLKKLNDSGFNVTITTSTIGLVSNKNWLSLNAHHFSRIIVSLDAPNSKHDQICGMQGCFESILQFIGAVDKKHIRINTVVTKYFQDFELIDFILFLENNGIQEWCVIYPSISNQKSTFRDVQISLHEFKNIVQKITTILLIQKIKLKLIERYPENYSGYWILYPDSSLILHNELDSDKDISLSFDIRNLMNIKTNIVNNKIIIPMANLEIKNIDESPVVSDILIDIKEVLKNNSIEFDEKQKNIAGEKGVIIVSIVTGIVSGIIANIVTSAITSAIKKHRHREDFVPQNTIIINNISISLGDFLNGKIDIKL